MLLHCKISESNHNETPEKPKFKNSTKYLLCTLQKYQDHERPGKAEELSQTRVV